MQIGKKIEFIYKHVLLLKMLRDTFIDGDKDKLIGMVMFESAII